MKKGGTRKYRHCVGSRGEKKPPVTQMVACLSPWRLTCVPLSMLNTCIIYAHRVLYVHTHIFFSFLTMTLSVISSYTIADLTPQPYILMAVTVEIRACPFPDSSRAWGGSPRAVVCRCATQSILRHGCASG